MSNSSIWLIDRTLSGATTPGQSGTWSNSNEEVLCVPQSSSITEVSRSVCLVSYLGHSLGESHLSAEMLSIYSTATDKIIAQTGFFIHSKVTSVEEWKLCIQASSNALKYWPCVKFCSKRRGWVDAHIRSQKEGEVVLSSQ